MSRNSVPRVTAFAIAAAARANWAGERNRAGQQGTAILKAWMDEMRANIQPIVRPWDRE